MRAQVVLCLVLGLLVVETLAGKGHGKDNGKGHGKGGKGGKDGQKCPNCMELKQMMRDQRAESKSVRQAIRDCRRREMQEARNARDQARLSARAEFKSLEEAASAVRHATHAALNESLQAVIDAAGQSFTDSLTSIEAKVDHANQVLQQYEGVEPLELFAAEVGRLEVEADEAKRVIEAAAAAAVAALPSCPVQNVTQGVCNGCLGNGANDCYDKCTQFSTKECFFNPPAFNPDYSPLENIMLHPEGLGCCDGRWLCNGVKAKKGDNNDIYGKQLVNHTTFVLLADAECEAERLANETEILDDAADQVADITAQLAHDIGLARAQLEEAVDAEFVVENEDGAVYQASCNQTVEILRAQRDYLKEIAAADQAYYDALVEPKQNRRASVKAARQAFRERQREIRKDHRRRMRDERKRSKHQRRQGNVLKDIVCRKGCPDFPPEEDEDQE